MQYIQQIDESDCGPACLAMIASHYNHIETISKIREFAGTSINGTNIKGMIDAAKKIGFNAHAVKGNVKSFSNKLPVPFVVTIFDDDNSHFVIISKLSARKVTILDPNPIKRKYSIEYQRFFEKWTGIILFFEPTKDFNEKKGENFFIKFSSLILKNKRMVLFSIMAALLLLIFGIGTSFFYKILFDEILFSNSKLTLNAFAIGMIFLILCQSIIGAIKHIFISSISFKIDFKLSVSYIRHIINLPISFFETRKSGEILSRFNDLEKIKEIFSSTFITFIIDVITISFTLPILISISPKLLGISVFSTMCILIISFIFSKIFSSLYNKAIVLHGKLQSMLFEIINGIYTIKSLTAENTTYLKYLERKSEYTLLDWKINLFYILNGFIITIISLVSNLLIYWIGSNFIIADVLSIGSLMSFNSLLSFFVDPLVRLSNIQKDFQESIIATRRLGEILDLDEEENEDSSFFTNKIFLSDINFRNVSFSYKSRQPIFNNLSVEIPCKKWTSIVGPNGCGKSSFIKLLLKFYRLNTGCITVGDVDLDEIDTKRFREKIGYVPQEVFLFSGTIKENIAYIQPDVDFLDVIEASKKAGAHDFIEQLPKKYNTILGEHGGGLSGGEKQKIALARALLSNPRMIILDEATSNLDKASEEEIYKVLDLLRKEGITIVSISHRLSTLTMCDKIIVMNNGNVLQQGNFQELSNQIGWFHDMLVRKE